jgi:hypothetical protein
MTKLSFIRAPRPSASIGKLTGRFRGAAGNEGVNA